MIYSISHDIKCIQNNFGLDYVPLIVGNDYDIHQYSDNINQFNPYANELTGLYHMWKYCDDEYIGLCHYRRAFMDSQSNPLSLNQAIELLHDCDMIIVNDHLVSGSLIQGLRYDLPHDVTILNKYYRILCSKVPDMEHYFESNCVFNPKNMFICRKEVMDKFCEFLFPVIIPILQQFVVDDASNIHDKRMLGYLFERILTFWIIQNNISTNKYGVLEHGYQVLV